METRPADSLNGGFSALCREACEDGNPCQLLTGHKGRNHKCWKCPKLSSRSR